MKKIIVIILLFAISIKTGFMAANELQSFAMFVFYMFVWAFTLVGALFISCSFLPEKGEIKNG